MNPIMTFCKKYIYALLSCVYLFAGGFLIGRNRNLISAICEHFGLGKPKPIVPKMNISEILDGNLRIQLEELDATDGNMTLDELISVVCLVKKYNPQRLFEIGTFDGRTTLNMAKNTPANAKVYTLDLLKEKLDQTALHIEENEKKFINKDKIGQRYSGKDDGKITQLYGDSATFDYSPFLKSMDFIFIDGAHTYEYVISDTRNALKMLKDKGVIVWHDYDKIYREGQGLTNALNEFFQKELKTMRHIENTSLVVYVRE